MADDLSRRPTRQPWAQEETSGLPDFLRELLRKFTAMVDEQLRYCRGLMVRFFKMTIPTSAWPSDCLTARTCNSGRLVERLYAEYGQIEIKRPVANRLILRSAGSQITVVPG